MILNEGGNVFANAEPFDHKDVPSILKTVNNALQGTGIVAIPVGSAATPNPGQQSGDMDVIVDEQSVLDFFKAKDAKSGRKALNDYISSKGLETAQSGINVHVNVPVGDQHHQVDIMVTGNAPKVAKFHTHSIPQGSPYKGVNKQLMMAILAKSKGYMWSAWQGLFDRTSEGKKGNFVSDDLDDIAKVLLGNQANSNNLGSVEAILKSLPDTAASYLLDRARQDPNWVEKKQTEAINRMRKLAGLKEETPPAPAAPAAPAPAPAAPAQPQVDPKNYKVPSVDYLSKTFKHPADVIDGAWPSESEPGKIGAWQPGTDFDDLVQALSGSQYRAAKEDPSFRVVPVKNDWEYVQRLLGTPEGKEYAVDNAIGLSDINNKDAESEFQRAQHKEFEKQANARIMSQKEEYKSKSNLTPSYE